VKIPLDDASIYRSLPSYQRPEKTEHKKAIEMVSRTAQIEHQYKMLARIPQLLVLAAAALKVVATPVLYDGRVSLDYTQAELDGSQDPFLTWVLLKTYMRYHH
jgi:hypothetical protein